MEDFSFQKSEATPLLAGLLSVPMDNRYPPLNLSPQLQRQKTMELLVQLTVENISKQPVLFLVEDLHWADPTTLEFLGLLVDQAPTVQILIMFTFRPEFTPPWGSRANLAQISLNRLPRRLATDMLDQLTGGKVIPEEVVAQIATKSDGVPLFVEELTRMVIESGLLSEVDGRYELNGPLPALAIPSTLQDSLTARLDRLSSIRESVQLAGVLGREFSYELIRAVSPLDDVNLAQHLEQLVTSEFLYQRGVLPESNYIFKHALIQDAAYNSLLISRRQQYHQQVAQVLEDRFPESVETRPELVAHHYTEAGLTDKAVGYWQVAGDRAARLSAYVESINHLTRGLSLLETSPDSAEKFDRELQLQVALATPLLATKGYGAPELERVFSRARQLHQAGGESTAIFPLLWGQIEFYLVRANHKEAGALAEQLLALAKDQEDTAPITVGHRMVGTCNLLTGRLGAALENLERSVALYDDKRHGNLYSSYGHDPKVNGLTWSAWCLQRLGYPDLALERMNEGLASAEELGHPLSQAFALCIACYMFKDRREYKKTLALAKKLVVLADDHGFKYWSASGNIFMSAMMGELENLDHGIQRMRNSLNDFKATGAQVVLPSTLGMLADLLGKAGLPEEGLSLIEEALDIIIETGERVWLVDLLDLKGKSMLQFGANPETVEQCFQEALKAAQSHDDKCYELRVAMSLARLWQKQGKNEEARELLGGIYGWFTEGFDTPDLIDAKALLEELA